MKAHAVVSAIAGLLFISNPILACDGTEIFADDFSDAQVSKDVWNPPDHVTISQGYMEIKSPAGRTALMAVPARLQSRNFNICADIVSPDIRQANLSYGVIFYWFKNAGSSTSTALFSNGIVTTRRLVDGRALPLGLDRVHEAINKGAGAKNSLRLAVKRNVVVVYGNERRLTSFRGYPEDNVGWIVLGAASEPNQQGAWRFTNIKVTELPQ